MLNGLITIRHSELPSPPPYFAPLAAVSACRGSGGAIQSLDSPDLDILRRRLRRQIFIQRSRFRLLDVALRHGHHAYLLLASERARDLYLVFLMNPTMGLRMVAVDVDPPRLAGALGLRSRREETCDIEPDIKTNGVTSQSPRSKAQI